jgi:transcriptional regulator with XRE-family HTH domain
MKSDYIVFADNLKFLRTAYKLSQKEYALKIGSSQAMIGSYEECRAFPSIHLLTEISRSFNITIERLCHFEYRKEFLKQFEK